MRSYTEWAFPYRRLASLESDPNGSDANNFTLESARAATDPADCASHLSTAGVARETDSHSRGNVTDRETTDSTPLKVSALAQFTSLWLTRLM